MTVSKICQELEICEKTFFNYLKRFRDKGIKGLLHGNSSKAPRNKKSQTELKKIREIILSYKYYSLNMTHAREKLEELHGIRVNKEVFRKFCYVEGFCLKKIKRRKKKVYHARPRREKEGELIQMDGSRHKWFEGRECVLISLLDDATSKSLGLKFYESESLLSCMDLIKKSVQTYGSPKYIYTDKAGVYGGVKREGFSHMKEALEKINTQIIYAHTPQAKGRVERQFGTLQDRLYEELKLEGIKTMDGANNFLETTFIPYWNKKFIVKASELTPSYEPLTKLLEPLEEIFTKRIDRVVKNDHTISVDGHIFHVKTKTSLAKKKVQVRFYPDGSIKAVLGKKKFKVYCTSTPLVPNYVPYNKHLWFDKKAS